METGYKYEEFTFDSAASGKKIFTRLYTPECGVKAVLQVVHGMAEHSALYAGFCEYLAQAGYAVVIDDHLGHGRSVSVGDEFGYFFEGGINNLILDEKKLHDRISRQFAGTPYFIMGHSMGSFITREYIARYGEDLCGAILMGTAAGMKPHMWLAQRAMLNFLISKHGPKAKIKFVSDLATRDYCKAYPGSENGWVTSDPEEAERYTRDPMCGFSLTISAYKSIGELINTINSREWYTRVPKKLPVLMISGAGDPVGGMGAGVRRVAASLAKTEHEVDTILYPNLRHALVTEVNREKVFRDIESFMEYKVIKAKGQGDQP